MSDLDIPARLPRGQRFRVQGRLYDFFRSYSVTIVASILSLCSLRTKHLLGPFRWVYRLAHLGLPSVYLRSLSALIRSRQEFTDYEARHTRDEGFSDAWRCHIRRQTHVRKVVTYLSALLFTYGTLSSSSVARPLIYFSLHFLPFIFLPVSPSVRTWLFCKFRSSRTPWSRLLPHSFP